MQDLQNFNRICVLKSERGICMVSVLQARCCSPGVSKQFPFCCLCHPGQPHRVNLLNFCCCSTHVIMLDCPSIPLKGIPQWSLFFPKKKCTRLTLYSHIRLVKAAKAKYFQECRHAFLKGTCIWGCQCGGRKIPALQAQFNN